jgi:MarR family transcriptional regulator for hemolysin
MTIDAWSAAVPAHSATDAPLSEGRMAAVLSLSLSLGVVQRAYRAAADKAVAQLRLSHAMAWPLLFIGRLGDGLRQGVLAEALGIEGPSLVRSLDQLMREGLVERREDAADRRAKTLHLTAAGRQVYGEIESLLLTLRSNLYRDVSDADIAACLRVFETLSLRLGAAVPQLPQISGK